MNYVIKKGIIDPTEGLVFKHNSKEIEKIIGIIRLVVDSDPPVPTDLYILLGEFPSDSGELRKAQDITLFDKKLVDDMKRVRMKLSDYNLNRKFYTALRVPQIVIDKYTG